MKTSEIDNFNQHLNSVDPAIQFTVEREISGTIPFLDVQITRKTDQLEFSVYRKLTHSGRYLNFDSAHPTAHKASVVSSLFYRASKICSTPSTRKQEEARILCDLRKNGYPKGFVRRVTRRMELKRIQNSERNTTDPRNA